MRWEYRLEMLCGGLLLPAGLLLGAVVWLMSYSWRLTLGVLAMTALLGACVLYRGVTRWQLYGYLRRAMQERVERE
jgi:hypothetical protein